VEQINEIADALSRLGVELYPGYYNFVHYYPALDTLPELECLGKITSIIENEEREICLYIHVPFCSTACKFCYYPKRVGANRSQVKKYLQYVEKESQILSRCLKKNKIHSVYVGGGSPSYMTAEEISCLLHMIKTYFSISNVKEFTFEVEPRTFNEEKLSILLKSGIDRISMGIQSLDDSILSHYRRGHCAEEAVAKSWLLRNSDVRTFNIDFMYGLAGQAIQDIIYSLNFIEELSPPSVTFYQTWFASLGKKCVGNWSKKALPLENIIVMKEKIHSSMKQIGYLLNNQCWYIKTQNEACLHFKFRWDDNPYVGIGQAAYSYVNGIAYQNMKNHFEYFQLIDKQKLPIKTGKLLSNEEQATRATILGLKTNEGVCISEIEEKYGVRLMPSIERFLEQLCGLGIFFRENGILRFTDNGVFWGDCVLARLMDEIIYGHEGREK